MGEMNGLCFLKCKKKKKNSYFFDKKKKLMCICKNIIFCFWKEKNIIFIFFASQDKFSEIMIGS